MDNNVKRESSLRSLRLGGYSIVLTIIVIAAVVILNLIVNSLPPQYTQIDLSGADVYQISEDSEKLAKELDTDITIYYVSTLANRNSQLHNFVQKYASMSDHIKIEYVDPEENPSFADKHGLTDQNSLVVSSELRSEAILYTDIYEYSEAIQQEYYSTYYYYYMMYQDEQYAIENIYSYDVFDADNEITSAIDYVTTDKLPVVYAITGHGEADISETIISMLDYNNILVESLNLMTSQIPENASMVVVNVPTSDITEAEKDTLIAYINGGGKVYTITDASNYSPSEMPNLTAVANHCGMDSYDGVVLENNTSYYSTYKYFLVPRLQSCKVTQSVDNVANVTIVMSRAHAITKLKDYDGAMTVSPILLTSEDAYIIGADETVREKQDSDVAGQFYLGAIAEDASTGGAFVWYSSSLIGDDMSYYYVNYNNLYISAYSITENCDKPQAITIDSVALSTASNLTFTETDIIVWTAIIQIVIPLAVLVPGIVLWIRRRRR